MFHYSGNGRAGFPGAWRSIIATPPPSVNTHTRTLYVLCVCLATQKSVCEMRGWLLLTLYCFVSIFYGLIFSLHLRYSCVDSISASCVSVVISSCRHEWVLHVDGSWSLLVSPKGHSDSGFVYSLLLSHCVCTDSRMRAVFNTSVSSHCGKYTRMMTHMSPVLQTTVRHESSDVSLKLLLLFYRMEV